MDRSWSPEPIQSLVRTSAVAEEALTHRLPERNSEGASSGSLGTAVLTKARGLKPTWCRKGAVRPTLRGSA
jgi:hypothetical protein